MSLPRAGASATSAGPIQGGGALSFAQHERLLWRVLGQLAKQGYVVPPDEARDLIHDFYLEAWSGLAERFDSERGNIAGYLFGAFYRFARRRIIDLRNWHGRLVDVSHLEELASDLPGPERAAENAEREQLARGALGMLEESQRKLLYEFLTAEGGGERELASRNNLTRYALREKLIDAIGDVAARLGHAMPYSSIDGSVATALWSEGRSIRDTAALLGISVADVQAARKRNAVQILNTIRTMDKTPRHRRILPMNDHPLALLKKALLATDDAALREVRQDPQAIMRALDEKDLEFSEEELQALERDPARIATVYEALAGADVEPAVDTAISMAMREVQQDEDREIGEAFAAALGGLPPRFHEWPYWFADVPPAPLDYQAYLLDQVVVQAGGRHAEGLVHYGMTPATFHGAARGIELLADRWRRRQQPSDSQGTVAIDLSGKVDRPPNDSLIPMQHLVAQLRGGPSLPPEAARPMLDWLVDVVALRPALIRGYQAQLRARHSIVLTPATANRDADLMSRWAMAGSASLATAELAY